MAEDKNCLPHLTGKTEKLKHCKRPKIDISDGFTIGGFKTDQTNEFEEPWDEWTEFEIAIEY